MNAYSTPWSRHSCLQFNTLVRTNGRLLLSSSLQSCSELSRGLLLLPLLLKNHTEIVMRLAEFGFAPDGLLKFVARRFQIAAL